MILTRVIRISTARYTLNVYKHFPCRGATDLIFAGKICLYLVVGTKLNYIIYIFLPFLFDNWAKLIFVLYTSTKSMKYRLLYQSRFKVYRRSYFS